MPTTLGRSTVLLAGERTKCARSQVEGELVEIHIAGDRADLRAESGDLISQHAWGWDLDSVIPVVVVVAESIREVQDGHLADGRRVLSNIEMGRLDRALSHGVRH